MPLDQSKWYRGQSKPTATRLLKKRSGGRTDSGLADGVLAIGQQMLSYCPKLQRRLSTLPSSVLWSGGLHKV